MAIQWGDLEALEIGQLTADAFFVDSRFAHGYERIEGRIVKMPRAGFGHGSVAGEIGRVISNFVIAQQLGVVVAAETDFIVCQPGQPDTVRAPDVAFIRAENVPPTDAPGREKFQRLIPNLVVEVVSPNQFAPELAAKAQFWLEVDMRLVWVAWPGSETLDVWRQDHAEMTLRRDATLDGFGVLPGFTQPVGSLF
jgi:Uma2 family endonuclease